MHKFGELINTSINSTVTLTTGLSRNEIHRPNMLKDAMVGFVYIQIVCYMLWDALLSVQTWLCISQAGLLGYWWYLVPQHALDQFDLMVLFFVRLWLAQDN